MKKKNKKRQYCENITKNNIKKIYQCKHIKQNKLLRDHVVKKKNYNFFLPKMYLYV